MQKDIAFFPGAAIHSVALLKKPVIVVKQITTKKSLTKNFISCIEIKSLNIC